MNFSFLVVALTKACLVAITLDSTIVRRRATRALHINTLMDKSGFSDRLSDFSYIFFGHGKPHKLTSPPAELLVAALQRADVNNECV
jgi:hypothetical protein